MNDCYSEYIEPNSGIKQGGLMSQISYYVFVDKLKVLMKVQMKSELIYTLGGMSYRPIVLILCK